MLVGQYSSRVDAKGRVALPKKLREQLGDRLIVTRGYEHSLIVVAARQWEALLHATGDKPFIIGAARDTNRFLFGNATHATLDAQGRFIIAGFLRTFAQIRQTAVFIGVGRFAEIWSVQRWDKYQKYLEKDSAAIADKLGSLTVKNR